LTRERLSTEGRTANAVQGDDLIAGEAGGKPFGANGKDAT